MRFFSILCLIVSLGLALPAAAQESDDWYQGKPIKDLTFEGLSHVDASVLAGITDPYIGKVFDDNLYFEVLGKLYAIEYFDTINPVAMKADEAGSAVTLKFVVTEKPTVSKIVLSGLKGLRKNDVQDVITLKTGDVVTTMKLRADEQAVINKYLEKGFPDIAVRSETKPGANGTVVVEFFITEGEKLVIESIRFEGNEEYSERTLKRQLSLSEKGLLGLKDGAFQEAKLTADRAAVAQYYRDHGYIDAQVLDVTREQRQDAKGNNLLTITFHVSEGRQYRFGGITFSGNQIFPTEQLAGLVYSKKDEVANDQRIQADLARVADLYYENGYLFTGIVPQPQKDEESGLLSYHITIEERGRAHIENIIIKGNEKTKDYVILREIPLETGDIFSKNKVMDGLRNLYNLQYFSLVAPETPPGSAENLMDLVINVEEQPTTDIQFGVTFSGTADPDTFPVSGMLKWNDRNFRGSGNIVGAEVNASPDTQSVSLEYTQRWMFGLPFSMSFDLTWQHAKRKGLMDNDAPYFEGDEDYAYPDGFSNYSEYANDDDGVPSDEFLMPYDQQKLSMGASTGYRFSTPLGNLSLSGGLRFGLIYTQYDADIFRPFDPILRNEHNHWTPQTSVWTSLSLDQRDIYYDPSRGYYGIERFGVYGLFGPEEEHYIRSDTKLEWFFTLLNIPITEKYSFKTVFGLHSGLSFIFKQPLYEQPDIEKANMLAVDGMFVGRGWSGEYSRKGLALWENWAELRFPVAPGILALDFFFDAAGVKATPDAFFNAFKTPDDTGSFFMRFSYGGGLRFTIPQFPFRFSLAKRFKIVDGQVEWVQGSIAGEDGKPWTGMDFVISFALSTY
ncbi:MAG: outer membrane protein assembly factor BamA [Treponema sp.]|jgi:outer membrane protein insertion porin family|nr:outer membrane protein assembly factor BamA [Treponema sp.]